MKLKNQNKYQIMKLLRGIEKGIKLKCFDCVGHQKGYDCENSDCSLYQFRPWSKKDSASYKNIKNLNINQNDKQHHSIKKYSKKGL